MGAIFTAFRNYAPLVIVAGQQTRAMLPSDPFLFAEDATLLPRPYVKWSVEPAARRTFRPRSRERMRSRWKGRTARRSSRPEDDWDARHRRCRNGA